MCGGSNCCEERLELQCCIEHLRVQIGCVLFSLYFISCILCPTLLFCDIIRGIIQITCFSLKRFTCDPRCGC